MSTFGNLLFFLNQKIKFKTYLYNLFVFPIILGMLLLAIRGGTQPIPINMSDAYFSNNNTLNDIAVNQNWNFIQSLLKNRTNFKGNPYKKHTNLDTQYFNHKFQNIKIEYAKI